MYDLIVIGRGPAGLSAAIYTARASLSTLLIGTDNGALVKTEKIDNYFGFSQTISGEKLLNNGYEQASRFGAKFASEEVLSIDIDDTSALKVITNVKSYDCRCILIATGKPLPQVKIQGVKEFEGSGVSYCTTCDGFFYKNKNVGVFGNKDFALHEAIELETFTKNITIYTNGCPLQVSPEMNSNQKRFRIEDKAVSSLSGTETLEKINFKDGSSDNIDGIFIAAERPSGLEFAQKIGLVVENGIIVTDSEQKTNIAGIFAAGDCASTFKQVSVAVGQGAIAGKSVIDFCKKK